MALIAYLLLITQIFLTIAEPIDDGRNVGTIMDSNGKQKVFNPGKFPYMVRLEVKRYILKKDTDSLSIQRSNCGGVLIRKHIVLTAAHCMDSPIKKKPRILAWLGILDTALEEGKGQEIPVRGYTIHQGYEESNLYDDIALLWLLYPVILDEKYVTVASLPTKHFNAVNKRGWIVGWGTLSSGKKITMLQKAVMRGVSQSECQTYYKHTKIVSTLICIMSDDKKKTSTHGDSGGPFIIQGMIVGISSFGAIYSDNKNEETGSDAKIPAAYTSVPRYLDWIEANIENGPKTILLTQPAATARPPFPPLKSKL